MEKKHYFILKTQIKKNAIALALFYFEFLLLIADRKKKIHKLPKHD